MMDKVERMHKRLTKLDFPRSYMDEQAQVKTHDAGIVVKNVLVFLMAF